MDFRRFITQSAETGVRREVKLFIRIITGAALFVGGFITANTTFFNQYHLFKVPYLAEFLIGFTFGALGYQILPVVYISVKYWLHNLVVKTIADIVYSFWDQQNKYMINARREAQNKKSKGMQESFNNSILLDTSVLIDGRILDIVNTGFLEGTFVVPKTVLNELHLLSDSENVLKRQRGRRGLDLLKDLKKARKVIFPDDKPYYPETDKELLRIAKKYKMKLMTVDFNLNKVAQVAGIPVLNINELSNAVKTSLLPGEELQIKIVQEGKEKNQGVAFLGDGTMIIVEEAKGFVGETLDVKVTKMFQTNAGKMIFAQKK